MNPRSLAILVLCGLTIHTEGGKIEVINDYDPGSCDHRLRGKQVLVKDRMESDKELTCVLKNSVYLWISADGSSTFGEYINPAYDCSDVLNENPHAQDGFYFINFHYFKQPIKVWCDMTTDGGGFILIGRKKTPVTWTVPSNSNPLSPYETNAHWLSSLGDAPIMEFRVQMATRDNLRATRAHWLYRLKAKRLLKNLMQKSKDCGLQNDGAGIGDIAYVKDLQTGDVVSHNLTCSKFGFGHHPSTGFGWASMNKCFTKLCPYGYANKKKYFQHDFHGSFSYSIKQSVSGMGTGATAFIGCDGKKCCGCFGPVGGTQDYCRTSCDTKPTKDTVLTENVYTWFWIRSSFPKAVWKKCMPFQVKKNGKLIWYKFVGQNVVPIEGRCNEHSVKLLDGIAVVPKGETIKEAVPPVSGLLAYRKENKEIYLRANGTWSALAQKSKIQKELSSLVGPSLNRLEDKIKGQTTQVKMEIKPKLDKLTRRLDAQNKSIEDKIDAELKPKLDKINGRLDTQNRTFVDKVNKEVKPKFDKLNGRIDRLDAQKRNLSQRVVELENEIKAVKSALLPVRTTPSPRPYECILYKWLSEPSRNSGYGMGSFCDRTISTGWYRFGGGAGTKIATSCVPKYRCGTSATGWMEGSHPTVAEGKVSRNVHFNWAGDCKKWSQNIQVLNCGAFYVYKLAPTFACSLRFCGSN